MTDERAIRLLPVFTIVVLVLVALVLTWIWARLA